MDIVKKLRYNSSYNKYRNATNDELYRELESTLTDFVNTCESISSGSYVEIVNYVENRMCDFEQLALILKTEVLYNEEYNGCDRDRLSSFLFVLTKMNDYISDTRDKVLKKDTKILNCYEKAVSLLQEVYLKFLLINNGERIVRISQNCISTYSKNKFGNIGQLIADDTREYFRTMCNTRDVVIKEYIENNSDMIRIEGRKIKLGSKFAEFISTDSYEEEQDKNNHIFYEDDKLKEENDLILGMMDWREINKLANKFGYEKIRQKGDHGVFKTENGKVVVIPQGRDIGKGLQKKIVKNIKTAEV